MTSQSSSISNTKPIAAASRFFDRRLWTIFVLGISSGFPWVLIGSAMSAWLQEAGLSRSAIGYFGSIFVVYAVNYLWAPLLDRLMPPGFSRFGQRRSWLLLMQILLFVLTVAIAFSNPAINLVVTSLLAFALAACSATQDIAIDAFRIDLIGQEEKETITHGSAMATAGWWTGYGLIGAIPFFLVDQPGWDWGKVYLLLAGVWLLLIGFTLKVKNPAASDRSAQDAAELVYSGGLKAVFNDNRVAFIATAAALTVLAWPLVIIGLALSVILLPLWLMGNQSVKTMVRRAGTWLAVTLFEPLREFFTRNGVQLALGVLAFVFLFKVGEAFLGRMSIVFYKEIGFSNSDIGLYSKMVGWWVTILFSVIGSAIGGRFGIVPALLLGGAAMAGSNLMFSWIAAVGPDTSLFAAAVVIDGFTGALATVAFVAFISYLTSHSFSATQYALLASLGNLGRTTLAAGSGGVVDWLDGDWSLFFQLTALMVLPSLIILLLLRKRLGDAMPAKHGQVSPAQHTADISLWMGTVLVLAFFMGRAIFVPMNGFDTNLFAQINAGLAMAALAGLLFALKAKRSITDGSEGVAPSGYYIGIATMANSFVLLSPGALWLLGLTG